MEYFTYHYLATLEPEDEDKHDHSAIPFPDEPQPSPGAFSYRRECVGNMSITTGILTVGEAYDGVITMHGEIDTMEKYDIFKQAIIKAHGLSTTSNRVIVESMSLLHVSEEGVST